MAGAAHFVILLYRDRTSVTSCGYWYSVGRRGAWYDIARDTAGTFACAEQRTQSGQDARAD